MSAREVAVVGMVLEIVSTVPADTVSGLITVTGVPSLVNSVNGREFYLDGLQLSISAIAASGAGATIPDPVPKIASISATCEKVEEKGTKVLRVGDETDTINATPLTPATPDPIDYPTSFKVRIKDAGQSKVKAV